MIYTHQPVLLNEVLTVLDVKPNGFYVDCTFGYGGHSQAILNKLDASGRLLSIDKDPAVSAVANTTPFTDRRFNLAQGTYCMLSSLLNNAGMQGKVNGVLFDLGISSVQLDDPMRGFSFQHDGPLDMRANPNTGISARNWLSKASPLEIAEVLRHYGEERYAKRIADRIVQQRTRSADSINTTEQLAKLVASVYPKKAIRKIHPATKTFQAIRIFINNEQDELKDVLEQVIDALAPGGRLVMISFHSLEDRLVKRFIKRESHSQDMSPELPIYIDVKKPRLKRLGKPIRPSKEEIEKNPRARSAIMRAAERLN